MLFFFLILLIGALGGTIYGYSQIKKINFSAKTILATFQDKNSFDEKLKFASEQEDFEIILTSKELTAVAAEGISGKNFMIKNIQVIVEQDKVDVFGTLTKPLNSQIKIKTVPQAENGKIKFIVREFKTGSLSMPKFINNRVQNGLGQAMTQNFQTLYETAEVQTIDLFDDRMVIRGQLK